MTRSRRRIRESKCLTFYLFLPSFSRDKFRNRSSFRESKFNGSPAIQAVLRSISEAQAGDRNTRTFRKITNMSLIGSSTVLSSSVSTSPTPFVSSSPGSSETNGISSTGSPTVGTTSTVTTIRSGRKKTHLFPSPLVSSSYTLPSVMAEKPAAQPDSPGSSRLEKEKKDKTILRSFSNFVTLSGSPRPGRSNTVSSGPAPSVSDLGSSTTSSTLGSSPGSSPSSPSSSSPPSSPFQKRSSVGTGSGSSSGSGSGSGPKVPPQMEGFLTKKGAVVKNWKKRWFCISPSGNLAYYKSKMVYSSSSSSASSLSPLLSLSSSFLRSLFTLLPCYPLSTY
jgi:hypothetical protein